MENLEERTDKAEKTKKPVLYLGVSNDNEKAIQIMNNAKIPFVLKIDEFRHPYVIYNNLVFKGIESIAFFAERYLSGRFD